MKNPKSIISELEKLTFTDKIDVGAFFDPLVDYKYEPIKHYIDSLKNKTKPETASNELFRDLIKDVLNITTFSEINIGTGYIDFVLKENVGNPILIELKPLFKLIKTKEILKPETLDYTVHQDQVLRYLKKNEYVILTNLKDTYLFSRNAVIEFEPFSHISFTELLNSFLDYRNIWDTVRRIEDQSIKVDLGKSFFEDLKNWYNELQDIEFIEYDKFSKEELIVLFLNKIIFIQTLDDFALIKFKHIVFEYMNQKDKWEVKGSERILGTFFNELEEYFDDFYDTELFKTKLWDYVVKNRKNTDKFMQLFETILGLDAWNKTFGKGMLHYNYRWIDEDIFGKAYETFIAENKKDTGIYYTPKEITQYMAKKLVDYLFEQKIDEILALVDKNVTDYETANKLLDELKKIKIIDTASGSGSFLIKVLREIYLFYQKIDGATLWVTTISGEHLFDLPDSYAATVEFRKQNNFNDHLQLISKIILNHIYAIDIDERALDTAKTNIWKEAIKLNPRIYNYKRLNGESNHILPNLELNFINGDSLADLKIEEQLRIIEAEYKNDIKRLHEIRDKYLTNPFYPEAIDEAIEIKQKIFHRLKVELPKIENPVFICLEFFYAYFDNEGNLLPEKQRGFEGVISNPPWEAIKPVEKEFAHKGKGSQDILDFKKWFNDELETNEVFKSDWEEYQKFYLDYNSYISERYKYQSTGDPNYYKYFFERNLEILRKDGMLNILVPSGIQTDKGCDELRSLITSDFRLVEMSSFENRGYAELRNGAEKIIKLFPEVDNRFKFTIMTIVKQPSHLFMTFDAKFYLHNPKELEEREPIAYNLEMMKRFSPDNLSVMEFRSKADYELCSKIRGEHKLFGELGFKLSSEFHMTNDSHLFHKLGEIEKLKNKEKFLPLYEGKMIHQFNSNYSEARYFINEDKAKAILLSIEKNNIKRKLGLDNGIVEKLKIKLDYQDFRFVYRAIGRSTDERTIISSVIFPKVFLGHSLNYMVNFDYKLEGDSVIQVQIPKEDLILIMSLFNSITLNYYIRNKISANLTTNFMYELPIPEVTNEQKNFLVNAGFTLLYLYSNKEDYDKLLKQLKIKIDKKVDPIKLRAQLETYIAKELYNLSKEDWQYLTSTFIHGANSPSKQELDQIIEQSHLLWS